MCCGPLERHQRSCSTVVCFCVLGVLGGRVCQSRHRCIALRDVSRHRCQLRRPLRTAATSHHHTTTTKGISQELPTQNDARFCCVRVVRVTHRRVGTTTADASLSFCDPDGPCSANKNDKHLINTLDHTQYRAERSGAEHSQKRRWHACRGRREGTASARLSSVPPVSSTRRTFAVRAIASRSFWLAACMALNAASTPVRSANAADNEQRVHDKTESQRTRDVSCRTEVTRT